MIIFGQQDYPQELGTGTGATIAMYGCALTSVASLLVNCFGKDTDPGRLNTALINVNGFADNGNGDYDLLEWPAINLVYSDITLAFNNSYPSSPADMSIIDTQLSKGISVVVGVDFNHNTSATQPSHYVEIYKKNSDGTYQMRDPWYKDDSVFDQRYAVNGMSAAQCILQIVSYNGPVSPTTPPSGSSSTGDSTNVSKATQVDQSLTFLKNKGYISDDNSNDYLKGQFLALIEALYSDYTSQRGRAGMWDQLCLKAGLTGDSNAITVDQLYQAIQSQVPQS